VDNALLAWQRWHRSRSYEIISAVLLTAALVAGAYGEAHPTSPTDQHPGGHPIPYTPTAAYLLLIVGGLALAWRRRHPFPVLVISTACVAAYSLAGWVNGSALLIPVAALYCVTREWPTRRAVAAAAVTLVVLMAATAINNPFDPVGGGFDLIPGLVAVVLFAGLAASNRRAYIETVKARAEEDARRQVSAERLRIARELHDVVAHTMATINVQAGVAAHVVADRPEAATAALTAIKTASRDGLRELRAILHVLRQADESDDGSPTQPAPGLAQLDGLVANTVAAGLATAVRRAGSPRPLSPAVDLTAYRIIQASLTNVIRHAGPATADVHLDYRDTVLRIEVTDTGRGTLAAAGYMASVLTGLAGMGGGHGIIGMRERAASVGGELTAAPVAGGRGFLVTACLPLDAGGGQPAGDGAAGEQAPAGSAAPVAEPDDNGGPGTSARAGAAPATRAGAERGSRP
jgi:signal transduction histidine kinase